MSVSGLSRSERKLVGDVVEKAGGRYVIPGYVLISWKLKYIAIARIWEDACSDC